MKVKQFSASLKSNKGFTLIEVMIAVTVFAVIAATLSETTSQSVNTALYLQEKTLAAFVAENHVANIRLSGSVPAVGESNDVADMAGREWRIKTKSEATEVPGINRVTVSVAEINDKESSLASLIIVLGQR